jgi:hypothetical protein
MLKWRRKIYQEPSMSVTEVVSTIKSRFDYLVCLDLIVFVCIFVIAGRPDGVAITLSAVVVGVGVLIYRCVASVKNRLATPKQTPKPIKAEHQFGQRARPAAASAAPAPAKPNSKSWLRDSE